MLNILDLSSAFYNLIVICLTNLPYHPALTSDSKFTYQYATVKFLEDLSGQLAAVFIKEIPQVTWNEPTLPDCLYKSEVVLNHNVAAGVEERPSAGPVIVLSFSYQKGYIGSRDSQCSTHQGFITTSWKETLIMVTSNERRGCNVMAMNNNVGIRSPAKEIVIANLETHYNIHWEVWCFKFKYKLHDPEF